MRIHTCSVMLMALMIFIFSILGMQLFGTTVTPTNPNYNGFQTDKIRFDSFFWSFTQVFYIITGDNWNVIMYDTMDQAGVWSGVFFIALVLLGQFVLLNLVLAIVLEGASDQMKENYISVREASCHLALLPVTYLLSPWIDR
jgi:hypothetical protein